VCREVLPSSTYIPSIILQILWELPCKPKFSFFNLFIFILFYFILFYFIVFLFSYGYYVTLVAMIAYLCASYGSGQCQRALQATHLVYCNIAQSLWRNFTAACPVTVSSPYLFLGDSCLLDSIPVIPPVTSASPFPLTTPVTVAGNTTASTGHILSSRLRHYPAPAGS
jgi:hypothetical protein